MRGANLAGCRRVPADHSMRHHHRLLRSQYTEPSIQVWHAWSPHDRPWRMLLPRWQSWQYTGNIGCSGPRSQGIATVNHIFVDQSHPGVESLDIVGGCSQNGIQALPILCPALRAPVCWTSTLRPQRGMATAEVQLYTTIHYTYRSHAAVGHRAVQLKRSTSWLDRDSALSATCNAWRYLKQTKERLPLRLARISPSPRQPIKPSDIHISRSTSCRALPCLTSAGEHYNKSSRSARLRHTITRSHIDTTERLCLDTATSSPSLVICCPNIPDNISTPARLLHLTTQESSSDAPLPPPWSTESPLRVYCSTAFTPSTQVSIHLLALIRWSESSFN
jgi:hypothetical protein